MCFLMMFEDPLNSPNFKKYEYLNLMVNLNMAPIEMCQNPNLYFGIHGN